MIEEKQTKDLKVFTKADVAQLLGCSPMTVHRLVRDKKLGYYRIGSRVMISANHIDEFLARCERTPKRKATA